jgi:hypothetical protein
MLKFRKKLREDDNIVEVGDVKLDAKESEVVFADKDKDIQVVVSPDPENDNSVTVAVLSNSNDDVEDEEVLGSASVEGSEDKGAEESRKAARREAFRKRLEARRSAKKSPAPARNEARVQAFRKRLEARRAAKQAEGKTSTSTADARKKAIGEARAKFRSKIGKKA